MTHDIIAYGIAAAANGVVTNAGAIRTDMQGSSAIFGGTGSKITIETDGSVLTSGAGAYGVEVGTTATVINEGRIVTRQDAAHGIVAGNSSTVINSGAIETSANNSTGVQIAGGRLTNAGNIRTILRGPAFAATPIAGAVITGADAHFTNTATGVVEATHLGVRLSASETLSFSNEGKIEVMPAFRSDGSVAANGGGVVITGTAGAVVSNSGTIISYGHAPAIRSLATQVRLTNSGTIIGNVALSERDDTILLQEGSAIEGILDAGAGTDSIVFQGRGVVERPILNVEHLTKGGSGDLILARDLGISQQVIVFGGSAIVLNPDVRLVSPSIGILGGLRGFGVVDGTVDSTGIIAPGTPDRKGILTITGGFRQSSAGILAIRLSPDGTSDRLVIGGPAAFGGTLALSYEVDSAGASFEDGQRFDVIAPMAVTVASSGNFTLKAPDLTFLKANIVATSAGGLAVEMDRLSYSVAASTESQASLGRMFDRLRRGQSKLPVIDTLETASLEQAEEILADYAPEYPGGLQHLGLMTLEKFADVVRRRAPTRSASGRYAWGSGFASSGRSRGAEAPASYDLDGVMAGTEVAFDRLHAGLAVGVITGDFARGSNIARSKTSLFAATAHYSGTTVGFDAAIAYGEGSPEGQRFSTLAAAPIISDGKSRLWSALADAAVSKTLGSALIEPHAGFAFHHAALSLSDESAPLPIQINSSVAMSLRSRVGARITVLSGGLRPYGDVSMSVELLERQPVISARLSSISDGDFLLVGDSRRRMALEAEAGVRMNVSAVLEGYVAGAITANDMMPGRSISAGLTYRW